MRPVLTLAALCAVPPAGAQTVPGAPPPIADNSFLVEEAYNQEAGVVQHIGTFARATGGSWAFGFTQEWPLRGQRHQLSYTVPVARADAATGPVTGLGDIALNYRMQFGGHEGSSTAVAPRLSVVLPTGASERGLGAGAPGVQVNLPLSHALSDILLAHSNAGITLTPRARDELGNRATTRAYGLGQSLIWLARPTFNVMLEGLWSQEDVVVGDGRTRRETSLLVSPGIRGALNFASGLQIVPGLAFPIGVGPSRSERGVFVYLSLEHPFADPAR